MINWRLRLQNKATLITLVTMVISFIYQILALFDIVPKVSEDAITQLVLLIINILAAVGIIVDPTTKGIGDSSQALTYEKPKEY